MHDHYVFFVQSYATINSTLFINVSKDLATTLVEGPHTMESLIDKA